MATELKTIDLLSKTWCCKCGHVLGTVKKIDGFYRLVIGLITILGEAEITCPICGSVREWHIGEYALNELIRKCKYRNQQNW